MLLQKMKNSKALANKVLNGGEDNRSTQMQTPIDFDRNPYNSSFRKADPMNLTGQSLMSDSKSTSID